LTALTVINEATIFKIDQLYWLCQAADFVTVWAVGNCLDAAKVLRAMFWKRKKLHQLSINLSSSLTQFTFTQFIHLSKFF
jgi:hypothetical protein